MEKNVPGSVGWTITGDRSVEFAKCPLDFIEKRVNQHGSKLFMSRALNVPTVFVCSNKGVKEILHDKEKSFVMGYKDFGYIYHLYGDLLLFYDGAEATRVRDIIGKLFDPKNGHNCSSIMPKIEADFLCELDKPSSIPLYETFKSLTTALGLKLFLDLDWKDSKIEFETIKSISIMHWHGLISVPLNIKIRGWSSSYAKAMEAKEYLLNAIRNKLYRSEKNNSSFMDYAREAGFKNEDETIQHLLLFISALIPKALSSMMTSFCIAMSGAEKKSLRRRALEDDDFLEDILLEVQRLWPPFLGGRRMTMEDVVIDGYKIPANTAVAFMTWFANRDPEVFNNPNEFLPERWEDSSEAKRNLVWTFGGGKRKCIGIDFIRMILLTICRKLLLTYDWTLIDAKDISYKTLPVSRPRQTIFAKFSKIT